jgi:hypothetical protein
MNSIARAILAASRTSLVEIRSVTKQFGPIEVIGKRAAPIAPTIRMSPRAMERFARNELLGDLPFEFDAVKAVFGHGFHPLKARQLRSIPKPAICPPPGRTPQTND